jgi:hypothetical protein
MHESFFANAPVLSWTQWLLRQIGFFQLANPSILSSILSTKLEDLPASPTGIQPRKVSWKYAAEYTAFLATHFYPASSQIQLCIPATLLETWLKNGHVHGIEIRSKDLKTLVGLVFSTYAGLFQTQQVGCITWLCVHPSWRRTGMTNCLLRWIYTIGSHVSRNLYLFRNDGWLKSIVPPIWSEQRICRKKRRISIQQKDIVRVPYIKWRSQILNTWTRNNPNGLLFDDTAFDQRLIEVWEQQVAKDRYTILIVQPTFEVQRTTQEHWCEILAWIDSSSSNQTEYEQAFYIEHLLDGLPYTWFESPSKMPHLDLGWKSGGISNWCAFGIDPGIPVLRPILSLCSN